MSAQTSGIQSRQNRTLFLSDLHLGARASRPRDVLAFLRSQSAETIYLVGDIFDIWHGGKVKWGRDDDAVVRELVHRAETGTRVVFLPGNHDAALRAPDAKLPSSWERVDRVVHETADGRKLLVMHGDQADGRILRLHIMTRIGSRIDSMLRWLDAALTRGTGRNDTVVQRLHALGNRLLDMGGDFEARLVGIAAEARLDGVICGHSHKPGIARYGKATYANCGDWVDSLTALVEDADGRLRLIDWSSEAVRRTHSAPKVDPRLAAAAAVKGA